MPKNNPTEPLVSVIIPTKNGLPEFKDVIKMLRHQKLDAPYEVIIIDSGSTDGTLKCVPNDDPRFRLIQITSKEFGHGKTRNMGIELSRGEFCAFLTHDAIPNDEYWLKELVHPLLNDSKVAGVFGRHIAHFNASPYTRWELETHFEGLKAFDVVELTDARHYARDLGLRQIYHFYSDNSSCLRKSVWKIHPYRDVDFSEDQLWAKEIVEAGYRKVFAWDSVVRHSHEFNPMERLRRGYDEARAFNQLFGYTLGATPKQALKHSYGLTKRDLKLAFKHGWWLKNPIATILRPFDHLAQQIGYSKGSASIGEKSSKLSRDGRLQAQ